MVTGSPSRLCSSRIEPSGASNRWASTEGGIGRSSTVERAAADLRALPQRPRSAPRTSAAATRVPLLLADVRPRGVRRRPWRPAARDRPRRRWRSRRSARRPTASACGWRPAAPGTGRRPSRSPRRTGSPGCPAARTAARTRADPALVAAEHGGQPAADAPVVQLHVLVRAELREDVRALLRRSPDRSSSSWLRRKVAHCATAGSAGLASIAVDHRLGRSAGQREQDPRVLREVEHHAAAGCRARRTTPARAGLRRRHVGLAEQHARHRAATPMLAPGRPSIVVLVRSAESGCTCSMTNGAPSIRKPPTPELQPERDHLADLRADRRVGPVEVGLEVVEAVVVPGLRLLVVRPGPAW